MLELKQIRWWRRFRHDWNICSLIPTIGQINTGWRFRCSGYAGKHNVGLFPILGVYPIIMRNGKLNRRNPRKIGCVHDMLAARSCLCFLAKHVGHCVTDRVECRNGRQAQRPATCLQFAACIAIYQGKKHKPRVGGHVRQYPVQMAFGAHHGPEMLDHMLCVVKLRQSCLGDTL